MADPLLHELAHCFETAGTAFLRAAEITEQMAHSLPDGAITTSSELDAALLSADPGATLVIAPTLRYLTPLVLTKPVTLRNAEFVASRATRAADMPSFKDGLIPNALDVRLYGIDLQKMDHLADIFVMLQSGCVLDGCRVLGDPTLGAKRGIAGNAPNVKVIRCFIDDCFGPKPGNDTQAFAAWDTPGPIWIEDNYASGGAETILFGGADPSSSANVPSDITILGNTITKNPAWRDKAIVKNLVEFKNARRFRVEDNDLSYCWGGEQGGYAFMLTPRNQDGTAPYSEVRDGVIINNRVSRVGAVIAMNGSDNIHPSGLLQNINFEDNVCADVDHLTYNGNDKLILIQSGPKHIGIIGNTIVGAKAGSVVYFAEAPNTCIDLNVTGNTFPPSEYGVMGASCAPGGINNEHGSAWTMFVQSGKLSGNVEQP